MQVQQHNARSCLTTALDPGASASGGHEGKLTTMQNAYNGVPASRLLSATWKKSRHSNPSGDCVEAADLPSGNVAVRNSRDPDGPALIFTRSEWDAFVRGARDGEFG